MQPLPLQIPGGIELVVIFLIFFVLLIPVALVVGALYLYVRRKDRLAELESRVETLEAELDEMGEE